MKRNIVKKRLEWAYSFETSKKWLTAIQVDKTGSKHTQIMYSKGLYQYCEWLDKTPDQLIEERKEQIKSEDKRTQHKAEEELREFCAWLEKEKGIKKSTIANRYHSVIKSFYAYNYYPLRLKIPKYVSREIQPHTAETIKKMLGMIDVRERAIILALKDSGMSREDFVTLKYGDIKEELENGKEFIHLRVIRQKEALEYDTFLGKNAVEQLKAYLELRKQRGEELTKDSPLFTTERAYGKPITPENLSTIFDRISKQTGTTTSPHRLRKFFETHMGLTAPSMLVKYWMGHSLGVEKSYFIPPVEKQREKYVEAYKEIDIFKTEISEIERRKQNIVDNLKLLPNITPEKLEWIINQLGYATTHEEIDNVIDQVQKRENLDRFTVEKRSVTEEEDCQKIVSEKELETWLAKGWHVEAVLPSGKIVISNE
ncbi:MAG: site-specific integrase [Candidatus Bathyarchaeota archaeon]|nr:site-specific integrase [Candidatus Bathyarchaeota archaeon]